MIRHRDNVKLKPHQNFVVNEDGRRVFLKPRAFGWRFASKQQQLHTSSRFANLLYEGLGTSI